MTSLRKTPSKQTRASGSHVRLLKRACKTNFGDGIKPSKNLLGSQTCPAGWCGCSHSDVLPLLQPLLQVLENKAVSNLQVSKIYAELVDNLKEWASDASLLDGSALDDLSSSGCVQC